MPLGQVQAVVGSPPYAVNVVHGGSGLKHHPDNVKGQDWYGTTPGQLGAMPPGAVVSSDDEPCTFWAASAQIMQELALLLPAGAVCAWVVKPYIKNKKIVPFDKQWQSLCEAHGFHTVEIIHASLIEHHGVQETFFGESEAIQTAKKSFFRRLCEKKGSPPIDYEVVLVTMKGEVHE